MTRKTWLSLPVLIGWQLSVACSPAPASSTPQANMPNLASVCCEQQGNQLEIVTAADGSTCDEWAYFRSECGPAR